MGRRKGSKYNIDPGQYHEINQHNVDRNSFKREKGRPVCKVVSINEYRCNRDRVILVRLDTGVVLNCQKFLGYGGVLTTTHTGTFKELLRVLNVRRDNISALSNDGDERIIEIYPKTKTVHITFL